MFDIGFFELMLIGVVALLVIGPQRLPAVARTAGLWIGRGKRLIASVKTDIEQEIRAEELKKVIKEQAGSNPLHEIIEDTKSQLESVESETASSLRKASSAAASKSDDQAGKAD